VSDPIADRQRFGLGEGCQLPVDVTVTVLWDVLSEIDMWMVLGDIATFHPEVFQEAMLDHARIMQEAQRRKAKRAREAGTAQADGSVR
jgi:hypothetical protein